MKSDSDLSNGRALDPLPLLTPPRAPSPFSFLPTYQFHNLEYWDIFPALYKSLDQWPRVAASKNISGIPGAFCKSLVSSQNKCFVRLRRIKYQLEMMYLVLSK
jgi:hypothetical protein